MEIYNENVNDLLSRGNTNLEVREDRQTKGIYVEGLSKIEVSSPSDIFEAIQKGTDIRKIAATRMNEKSSRSHTVFKFEVQMIEKNTQTARTIIKSSEINLVDLAGSEGVGKTQLNGLQRREGNNINKSLLALSNVIYSLGKRWNLGKSSYINFRDSKLTRILKDSLQGNA